MTESQLRAFPAFRQLPVYDERAPEADAITAAGTAGPYKGVRECSTLQQVEDALKDSRFVPLGALRAGVDGGAIVIAYFGENP